MRTCRLRFLALHPLRSSGRGGLLLEAVLAIAIFAIFLSGVGLTLLVGQHSPVSAGDRVRATFLAEQGLEGIRYMRDQDFSQLTPGTHVPVLPVETLLERQPDYVLILAWNFADEIVRQQAEYARRGGAALSPPEPGPLRGEPLQCSDRRLKLRAPSRPVRRSCALRARALDRWREQGAIPSGLRRSSSGGKRVRRSIRSSR